MTARDITVLMLCSVLPLTVSYAVEAVPQKAPAPVTLSSEEVVRQALNAKQFDLARTAVEKEKRPGSKLYLQALIDNAQGKTEPAVREAARAIALYYGEGDWLPRAELFCVQAYMDLNLLDAADVTAAQVQELYKDTDTAAKAAALQERIKQLKAEKESEGSKQ